jgi:hypothetical protein
MSSLTRYVILFFEASHALIIQGTLPKWTRTVSTGEAPAKQNTNRRANRGRNVAGSPPIGVDDIEDWDCISGQSGEEDNGAPGASKRLQEIANKNREARRANDQTQRKHQQSEINRKAAEKQKAWEARRAELKTWRQTGGQPPAPKKKEGWFSWISDFFTSPGQFP